MSQQLWEANSTTEFLCLLQAPGSPSHPCSAGTLTFSERCNTEAQVAFQSGTEPPCCLAAHKCTHRVLRHKAMEDGSYPTILHQLLSSPHPSQQTERGTILGRRASEGAHSRLKTMLQVQSELQEPEKRRKIMPSIHSFSPVRHLC